jgi:xanthine dehydrogenase accessory factor
MKDILSSLIEWNKKNKQAALATVLQTWGSSPRQSGAHMIVDSEGNFAGSVSGGCVETAVVQESIEVISTGRSKRIKYGVADKLAWEVGLACGGEVEIFISPISWKAISKIIHRITAGEDCWYQISLDENGTISSLPSKNQRRGLHFPDQSDTAEKIILNVPPDPEIIIVGGVNISQHLVAFAKLLEYKITLIDPRKAFANPQRFPLVEQIINLWPEEAFKKIKITTNTAIIILTHDDKIDIPAISLALNSPAFYIGALGSKKTQTRRNAVLSEMGVSAEKINLIHGPIGLDLGAKNPLEIALAITAEITAVANQKGIESKHK